LEARISVVIIANRLERCALRFSIESLNEKKFRNPRRWRLHLKVF